MVWISCVYVYHVEKKVWIWIQIAEIRPQVFKVPSLPPCVSQLLLLLDQQAVLVSENNQQATENN